MQKISIDMTTKTAIAILQTELLKHGYLYDSFAASIESSIKEQNLLMPFESTREIAEKILDMVIGAER